MTARPFILASLSIAFFLPTEIFAQDQTADLVLINGKVVTLDQRFPVRDSLAIRGDRILAVGKKNELKQFIGPKTKVIDVRKKLVIPGFIESHGHFVSLGRSKMMLDLRHAKSWHDIVQQVAKAAKSTPKGEWIIGRGWHQEKWQQQPKNATNGYPTHDQLSALTPDHPVLLTHASGHMSFANAHAMSLAKVTAKTSNPSGGEILHNNKGEPTGIFRETAADLIERARAKSLRQRSPEEKRRELLRAIELASAECLSKGVTSFQDAGSPFATVDLFKELAKKKQLKVRLWIMLSGSNIELETLLTKYFMVGFGDHFLTVRAIKRILDGALGSHGAWLLQPYDDLPEKIGLNTVSLPSLNRTAELAAKHNYQLCVHAIGDRANRELLDVYEKVFKKFPSKQPRRWRVEHAQHLHPDDVKRFAKLNVIASMQGIHCTSDAPYVLKRLGIRRAEEGAYVWQDLLKSGAIIANGTDVPVEDVSPIACFYASITRKLANGTAFFPKQKMTRMQALLSYTLDAAYAAFEEDIKGSLSPGKLADIVVLSRDILTIPDEQILDTEIEMTIVGGEVVFEKGNK